MMATFRNRNGKWQVRVRRKGQPAVVKSFQSKQDERAALRKPCATPQPLAYRATQHRNTAGQTNGCIHTYLTNTRGVKPYFCLSLLSMRPLLAPI